MNNLSYHTFIDTRNMLLCFHCFSMAIPFTLTGTSGPTNYSVAKDMFTNPMAPSSRIIHHQPKHCGKDYDHGPTSMNIMACYSGDISTFCIPNSHTEPGRKRTR